MREHTKKSGGHFESMIGYLNDQLIFGIFKIKTKATYETNVMQESMENDTENNIVEDECGSAFCHKGTDQCIQWTASGALANKAYAFFDLYKKFFLQFKENDRGSKGDNEAEDGAMTTLRTTMKKKKRSIKAMV